MILSIHGKYFMKKKAYYYTKVADVKAMMGDAGDNYPGVKGIVKTCETISKCRKYVGRLDKLTKGQKIKLNNALTCYI